jgi:hypothetical protein
MTRSFAPFRLLLVAVAGRINQQQRDVIEYLNEEILDPATRPRRVSPSNSSVTANEVARPAPWPFLRHRGNT